MPKNTEPLTPKELKDFEDEVAPLGKEFCRRCSYCLPCPNDILDSDYDSCYMAKG